MAEQEEMKTKLTVGEALNIVKQAWDQSMEQEAKRISLREAYRVIIASRIRDERAAAKMTQAEVSKKIHVNPLTYRGYENCKCDIPIVHLVQLADLYQVSMDYLTGRTEPPKTDMQDIEDRLKRLEAALENQNK